MNELEKYDKEINEMKTTIVVNSIVSGMEDCIITTDNVCPTNGLCGLDSICIYFADGLKRSAVELRERVLDQYSIFKPPYEDVYNEDFQEEYEEWDDENEDKKTAKERDKEKKINLIALMTRMGLVLDESKSKLNGLTPLEQITCFLLKAETVAELNKYKDAVYSRYLALAGGYKRTPGMFGLNEKLDFDQDSSNTI